MVKISKFFWNSVVIFIVAMALIISQNVQQNLGLPGFSLLPQPPEEATQYSIKKPEEVVRQYFESWNRKDWPNMYSTISDGFKKIEPTAKDLATFSNFVSNGEVKGVRIVSIKESSNDGKTAIVDYNVEFTNADGSKQTFSDEFTLKFRQGDVIQGWKLIHPYGQNVDTS